MPPGCHVLYWLRRETLTSTLYRIYTTPQTTTVPYTRQFFHKNIHELHSIPPFSYPLLFHLYSLYISPRPLHSHSLAMQESTTLLYAPRDWPAERKDLGFLSTSAIPPMLNCLTPTNTPERLLQGPRTRRVADNSYQMHYMALMGMRGYSCSPPAME